MFLDLAPTCRKCMHPKNCTAPTQERVRLPGGLGRTGNHSAILMARVKLTVGWKATPVPVSHGDVGGGKVIVAPVWRWFGLPPVKVNADDMVLCNDTCLEEWRPTPLTGHGMMSIFSMCIAHLKKKKQRIKDLRSRSIFRKTPQCMQASTPRVIFGRTIFSSRMR